MKAAVLRQLGHLDIEEVKLDGPREEELRIRVLASGLCHSDYHMINGDLPTVLPAVLGHEAAGVIEAVGSGVSGFAPGDMVITCFSAFCGHCHECQDGHSHRCEDKPGKPVNRAAGSRITRNGEAIYQLGNLGGFAEEMVVHQRSAVKMPEGMPPSSAALMGCGVLTGTGAVINAAKVEPGSTVAVLGCGGVGLNAVQGARIAGAARIIAIDLSTEKLEMARKFGATDVVLAGPEAIGEVTEMTRGGVDYAFEVVGTAATAQDALAMIRTGGTLTLVGVARHDAHLSIPITSFLMSEKKVIGTLMGSAPFQTFLPKLAAHYLNGNLLLDELVSQQIPLEAINQGYAQMAEGKVARSVITF
ncbi:MAG: Zn-dependent alcohol dehydrogenase [Novosphingobium sp.]|nr:Zn-dependent alcohol dehydrogenase [Novosphingobium sp.]